MTEVRQRVRPKGAQFDSAEIGAFLYAFGDDSKPLAKTVEVLDEILTDYIIEACHSAAQCASYSHRQKIKLDDFKFALRNDPVKLGRVIELLAMQKEISGAKRNMEIDQGKVVKAQLDGEKTGPGRGKRRKVEGKAEEKADGKE